MTSKIVSTLLIACALASTAFADRFPSYYPKDGFQRTGRVDAVQLDERKVVINDIPYRLSDSVVVHTLSSYSVSIARVRSGKIIAFKLGSGRAIAEIWFLPSDYDVSKGRR